jgi:hypothetical protein
MKYEYLLHTWGGFYNKEHQDKHGEVEGYHYFDTKQDRSDYLAKLRKIETELNAIRLVAQESEGYNTRTVTTLHRVIKWKGEEYYTKYELSPNYPYDVAKYHLENKWYPGCNDYPLGKDFNYENNDVETIQEWITGSFDISDE